MTEYTSAAAHVLSEYASQPRLKPCAYCGQPCMLRGRGLYCSGHCKSAARWARTAQKVKEAKS